MSTPNPEPSPSSNMDALKQQTEACEAGCACHGARPSGRRRWVLGAVILAVAAVLVVRAVVKTATATTARATAAVAAFSAPPGAPAAVPAPAADASAASATVVGQEIGGFAELNRYAAETSAVFVLVPKTGPDAAPPPAAQMQAAVRTLAAQGKNVGLFTLKADSLDYEQIDGQVAAPVVLVMVKGGAMQAIAGEITEAKLVQGFLSAANPGGCGTAGCSAATPTCK